MTHRALARKRALCSTIGPKPQPLCVSATVLEASNRSLRSLLHNLLQDPVSALNAQPKAYQGLTMANSPNVTSTTLFASHFHHLFACKTGGFQSLPASSVAQPAAGPKPIRSTPTLNGLARAVCDFQLNSNILMTFFACRRVGSFHSLPASPAAQPAAGSCLNPCALCPAYTLTPTTPLACRRVGSFQSLPASPAAQPAAGSCLNPCALCPAYTLTPTTPLACRRVGSFPSLPAGPAAQPAAGPNGGDAAAQ
jgi:hypothetical protein